MVAPFTDCSNLNLGSLRLLLDVPFRDGCKHWHKAIYISDSSQNSPSLVFRITYALLGTVLWIPLVNIVVDVALRILRICCSKYQPAIPARSQPVKTDGVGGPLLDSGSVSPELSARLTPNSPLARLDGSSTVLPRVPAGIAESPSILKTKVDPSEAVKTSLTEEPEDYTKYGLEWAYVDALSVYYQDAFRSEEWKSPRAKAFIQSELEAILNSFENLQKRVPVLIESLERRKTMEDIQHLLDIPTSLEDSKTKIKSLLEELRGPETKKEVKITGLENVGNTCYMNSALQPLLALGNFPELISMDSPKRGDETEEQFKRRTQILLSLREFTEAWKRGDPSSSLGRKVGQLRTSIFRAGLLEGGFIDPDKETHFQDAGSFFELVLHVIGRGFQVVEKRIPYREDGTPIERIPNEAIHPIRPYAIYQTKTSGSVQERINACKEPTWQDASGWRVLQPDGKEINASLATEEYKILGEPPEFLIISVNNATNQHGDQGHVVTTSDFNVDLSPLFEQQISSAESQYELVGFAQNHDQVHWTSVVRVKEGWRYCNDDRVEKVQIDSREFTFPANYLVYKKK